MNERKKEKEEEIFFLVCERTLVSLPSFSNIEIKNFLKRKKENDHLGFCFHL